MRSFATLIPDDPIPITDEHRRLCRTRNLDVENELAKHRIWAIEHQRRCIDWGRDFELWLRNARIVPAGKRTQAQTQPEPTVSPYLAEAKAAGIGSAGESLFTPVTADKLTDDAGFIARAKRGEYGRKIQAEAVEGVPVETLREHARRRAEASGFRPATREASTVGNATADPLAAAGGKAG